MKSYPTPQAIVLSKTGVFYDNGRKHPLSERLNLNNLGAVLAGASTAFRGGEGVVMLDAEMPAPADPSLAPEFSRVLDEQLAGWKFTELRMWTTFIQFAANKARTIVHVGFLPELEREKKLGTLLDGHQGLADIAWRLGRYNTMVGVPWRYTAGVSGCAALRSRFVDPRPGKQPLWHHELPIGIRGAGPLVWRASDQPEAGSNALVHVWDVNAMYLAGIKNAKIAWGELVRHNGAFDPSWPGFWELDTASLPAELLDGVKRPPVVAAARAHKGAIWVSTEVAKYLAGRVGSLDVLDVWVCENGETIARPFAERLMAARNGEMGPVGPAMFALKRTYAEMVGMVARPGGSIHRVDWSAAWMDVSRCNMLRRTDKVNDRLGVQPVAVQTDAVYYVQPDPGAPGRVMIGEVLGEGTSPGLFKYQGALTVDQYRAKFGLAA